MRAGRTVRGSRRQHHRLACAAAAALGGRAARSAALSLGTASSRSVVIASVPVSMARTAAPRMSWDRCRSCRRCGGRGIPRGRAGCRGGWCSRSMLPSRRSGPARCRAGRGCRSRTGVVGMTVKRPAICRPRGPANSPVPRPRRPPGEGGGDALGEVLELVGGLGAGPGAEVEVVKLIDQDQVSCTCGQVADFVGDLDLAGPGRGSPRKRANSAASIWGVAAGGTVT